MNTASSDAVMLTIVKPISLRAVERGLAAAVAPASMWRVTFSVTTIASSTTNPVAIVSAISDRLSRL